MLCGEYNINCYVVVIMMTLEGKETKVSGEIGKQ